MARRVRSSSKNRLNEMHAGDLDASASSCRAPLQHGVAVVWK